MKLSQVLAGLEPLSAHADGDLEIGGVSYDSRTTRPGDLFVAVTGYAVDGHRFIHKAVENGAVAVLCERPPEEDVPYVTVSSTRAALAQVGANWFDHPAEKLTVVGVTGTNGKTTVTYLLKSVLEQCYGAKVGLIGTIQNMIGDEVIETERTTPESFELQGLFARMVEAGCSHAIMEVSSHALVLHRVDCIPFAVGVFTNLTEDHLDFHKTMEEYGKAKAQLFRRCKAGVLNHDDPAWETMADGATCTIRTYTARGADAQVSATDLDLASDHVSFTVRSGGQCQAATLGIPGGFTVYNALAVIGASLELGLSLPEIAAALSNARGVKGRVEVVPTPGKPYTILIDYAHTPDGLENVLRAVQGFCKGRVIAVFGCGGDRDPIKRPIMGRIGVELSDLAVITSDNPRTEDPMAIIDQIVAGFAGTEKPYVVIENRREAIRWAMDHAEKDDIIVLCGKGHETYQILGTEKTHLDEREEVAAHLAGH